MLRLHFSITLNYEVIQPGCDFIFNIHAAKTAHQVVVSETLRISKPLLSSLDSDVMTHNRFLRLQASTGPLSVNYEAVVDLTHHSAQPEDIAEVPISRLPGGVLPYIYPSRYCESDRLHRLAVKEFGHLPQGYARVRAICEWVQRRVTFRSNSSNGSTTAIDTLIDEAGVCRDSAHLMIALCRGVNIPARFATGIDYGADPDLGPTDFHAYVEVFLSDVWYLFDPSGTAIPMGFVRFATGRDAADCAFATMFGAVSGKAPVMTIQAIPNAQDNLVVPQHVSYGLSTDGPPIHH